MQGEEDELDRTRSGSSVGERVTASAHAAAVLQSEGVEAVTGEAEGALCDRCFQPITAEHAARCMAGMEEDVREADDALQQLLQASGILL